MVLTGYPKTARLKDGIEVTLRPMEPGDVDVLHEFFTQRVPPEDRLFLRYDVADRKVIERWMEGMEHSRVQRILMFCGGELIADGAIEHHPVGWTSHIAEIRLVVARRHQNMGAGLALLRELVHLAQQKRAELIKAQVFEDATKVLAIFQKLGFRMEAVLHDFAKDIKGNRKNVVVLIRDTNELWQQMEDLLLDSDWRGDS